GRRLPLALRLPVVHRLPPRGLRAAGADQRRLARRDPGRRHLRRRQRTRRALRRRPRRPDRGGHLRPGHGSLAAVRGSPPRIPRPHPGESMSTTTAHPAPTAGPGPEHPSGTLPVLAVDLVTEPALLDGIGELARGLEQAGIGALTLSDGGLHPLHVASLLAPLTRDIGLLPRTDAVYVEPFHLATQLMSLDHISRGRAGWLLRAETDPAVAAAVGRAVLDLGATAREAADVLTASRLQDADFEGQTFSVRGPAITPRSPQGLLPVLVADTDREAVGEHAASELADGRVLDLDVSVGARTETAAETVRSATASEGGPALRLVRLVG